MQHRYVGDAGDFAKYSLLKALADGDPPLALGVMWYLYPDEGHNGDGRHISYLSQEFMRQRETEVHDQLRSLVETGSRSVLAVECAGILPSRTEFYSVPVAISGKPRDRLVYRGEWFSSGLRKLKSADILFFDPDNGIETGSLKHSDYRAGKYALWNEIEAAWVAGKTLVIYNHLNRTAPAPIQTERLTAEFSRRLPGKPFIVPLLFRRGSCRHLWVVAQPSHVGILAARIQLFMKRGWAVDTECELPPLESR